MTATFKDGPIDGVVVDRLTAYHDERGWLMEMFRIDDLAPELNPTMGYVSETHPGVCRGPHEHAEQADLFLFVGPGEFQIRLWDNRPGSTTYENMMVIDAGASQPTRLVVPPGVVHGYKVVGSTSAISYNFPNRLYRGVGRKEPIDEIRHEADPESPYLL